MKGLRRRFDGRYDWSRRAGRMRIFGACAGRSRCLSTSMSFVRTVPDRLRHQFADCLPRRRTGPGRRVGRCRSCRQGCGVASGRALGAIEPSEPPRQCGRRSARPSDTRGLRGLLGTGRPVQGRAVGRRSKGQAGRHADRPVVPRSPDPVDHAGSGLSPLRQQPRAPAPPVAVELESVTAHPQATCRLGCASRWLLG